MSTSPRPIDARTLADMLADGEELALLDLREELTFSDGHLLHARSCPLSRIEMRVAQLVPRRSTRVVLCDGGEGLNERGATVLARFGYDNLFRLDGGEKEWASGGLLAFSGVYVPSKGFGEIIEHEAHTPNISAEELHRLMAEKRDMVVLDSRPFDEYSRMSIPTGIDVPGAELVLHVHDIAPSPDTLVVVNCAGRTRSIIGAQSLINAGVKNKVVALRNGTMGWELAGFSCDHGQTRRAPPVSPEGLAWAKTAAERVAQRFGVERIGEAALAQFMAEKEKRTLYLFDVRDPPEYEAGHVAGAISAPGGQLVQATDLYVGTLGARIVLIDDREVRALMTASWLRQMGWREVYVIAASGSEKGYPPATILGYEEGAAPRVTTAELADLLARNAATLIDLSLSRTYAKAHIPGAWFAIRARLDRALAKIKPQGVLVLTSEDGVLAALAAAEAATLSGLEVRVLSGGNATWAAEGRAFSDAAPKMADDPIDAWLKPYERAGGGPAAMQEYLSWETDLLERIKRDRSFRVPEFR